MEACEIPSGDIRLPNVVHLGISDPQCDFDCAREAAIAEARLYDDAPELLTWFDKKRQSFYPIDECCVEGEPSWLAYATAKGADLTVDVNHEDYLFLFRSSRGLQ